MERSNSHTISFLVLIFVLWNLMFLSFGCKEVERHALLSFKQSLSDPANHLSSWSSPDCCKWSGITWHNKTGRVIKLDLRNRNQYQDGFIFNSQEVNSSLLHLKSLQYLDLSMNNFQLIPIPNFFGYFHELRYLNLSLAWFGGDVPHHLGNLSNLRSLDLSCAQENIMRGDDLSWVSGLSSLLFLDMSMVDLRSSSNPLQGIDLLPRLLDLRLYFCNMFVMPNSYFYLSNLTALTVFDLTGNFLEGPFPSHLQNSTSLEVLSLEGNRLNGPLPDYLGSMIKLETISLSYNDLNGTVENVFSNMCNLKSLRLMGNSFRGEFPSLFQNSSCIKTNRLNRLELAINKFNSTIPPYLGKFTSLRILNLYSNHFHGVMSEVHFDELSNLKFLDLRFNSLSLELGSGWLPPFQLETISLSSMKVGPKFPLWLTTQNRFNVLELSNASLSGELPRSFFNFSLSDTSSELRIDLSSNQLQGIIPNILKSNDQRLDLRLNNNNFEGNLPYVPPHTTSIHLSHNFLSGSITQIFEASKFEDLSYLTLAYNSFSGTIPYSFCKLKELSILDLLVNKFTGGFPHCLCDLPKLSALIISSNELVGVVPESIGKMYQLDQLLLINNNFEGHIPSSMKNCTNLKTLDLGGNKFSGSIPPWIGENLPKLRLLKLRSNELHGSIPLQLCWLINLQFLDLAENTLSGTIPLCFSNFTHMVTGEQYAPTGALYRETVRAVTKGKEVEYSQILRFVTLLDLSSNNLVGQIPESLIKLHGLIALNLSRNRLEGNIPGQIGGMLRLESLFLNKAIILLKK